MIILFSFIIASHIGLNTLHGEIEPNTRSMMDTPKNSNEQQKDYENISAGNSSTDQKKSINFENKFPVQIFDNICDIERKTNYFEYYKSLVINEDHYKILNSISEKVYKISKTNYEQIKKEYPNASPIEIEMRTCLSGWKSLQNYFNGQLTTSFLNLDIMQEISDFKVVNKIVHITMPDLFNLDTGKIFILKTCISEYKNNNKFWIVEHNIEPVNN